MKRKTMMTPEERKALAELFENVEASEILNVCASCINFRLLQLGLAREAREDTKRQVYRLARHLQEVEARR